MSNDPQPAPVQPTPVQPPQPTPQVPLPPVTPTQTKKTMRPLVVVFLVVLLLCIGSIGGYLVLRSAFVSRKSPVSRETPVPKANRNQLPHIPEIGGKFLTSDYYISHTPTIYLCVSSQDEFKNLVEKIVTLEKNNNKFGYEKNLLPQAKWIQEPEYFYVNFDYGVTIWDILNCNYFTSSSTISNITLTQKGEPIIESLIGTLKNPVSEESVNNLITFLSGAHMLPSPRVAGWGSILNYSKNVNNTSNEILITETLDTRFCGDYPGPGCSESRHIYTYRTVKKTGELFFSYSSNSIK